MDEDAKYKAHTYACEYYLPSGSTAVDVFDVSPTQIVDFQDGRLTVRETMCRGYSVVRAYARILSFRPAEQVTR